MSDAIITWISGPVLKAVTREPFHLNEAALIGDQRLLGEVIRINGDEVTIQVYEDTTGLHPGDIVDATGSQLSVRLSPALLGNIYDGLLRPLNHQGRVIKPGVNQAREQKTYPFKPTVKIGDKLPPGSLFGNVHRKDARVQRCMSPPDCKGRVVSIEAAGEYTEKQILCVLDCDDGETRELSMSHKWPVRVPRPVAGRLPIKGPLFTGQRILDSLFPLGCGGRAALPGGFGTGKTVLQQTLAK
jgi:V/A-type H+-transporting ATPase subunit A